MDNNSESELIVGQGLRVISAGENSERMSGDLWGQISVAKSFPRSLEVFRRKVEADVCSSAKQADECTYLVRRGRDDVEGPSVRFAEAILRAWGNVRVSTEIADDTGTHIVARARFWDLESNMAFSEDVFRRVTTKEGNRYSDDMIGTTKNAAQAIAFRNVVLAGIPKSEWSPLYEKSAVVAKSALRDQKEFDKRKQKVLQWFRKAGITDKEIEQYLGAPPDVCTPEEFVRLEKIGKSIHEGFETFASVFGREEQEQTPVANQNKKPADQTAKDPQKWTVDELSGRFSTSDPELQSSAIVLAINAASVGDITASELKQLAVDYCGYEGDICGQLFLDILNATSGDSLSTIANTLHATKSQKKITEDLHKALSGFVARRMRELKGKK